MLPIWQHPHICQPFRVGLKEKKTFAASSLPVKESLWKYIEIYNIVSGESAEIVKFTQCCHVEAKLVSVIDVRKEKGFLYLVLNELSIL